jgi:hypothetical protein
MYYIGEENAGAIHINFPSELKNPHSLKFTGATKVAYDGSQEITVDLPTAFYINISNENGNYTKDKTMAEIQSAHEAGRPLYCNLTIGETPIIAVLTSSGTSSGDVPYLAFSAVSYTGITSTSPIYIATIFIIGEEVFIQYSNIPKYEDIPSIDSTLLIKGNAADAKAVGDILALKADKTDIIQSDWEQTNETAIDFIKNKPDVEDAIILAAELGFIDPLIAEDGAIYTDGNNTIYTL